MAIAVTKSLGLSRQQPRFVFRPCGYNVFLNVYPIFLYLSIERGQANLEQSGRFCLVAVGVVKNLDDVVALHALQIEGVIVCCGGIARKHVYGQVVTVDFAVADDKGMLYGIHHFSHIARPWIRQEQILCFGRQCRSRSAYLFGITPNEVLGKEQYVFLALAQRWKKDAEHGEPEVEVLAETPIGYFFLQIAVGG